MFKNNTVLQTKCNAKEVHNIFIKEDIVINITSNMFSFGSHLGNQLLPQFHCSIVQLLPYNLILLSNFLRLAVCL